MVDGLSRKEIKMEKFEAALFSLQSALHDLAIDACRDLNTDLVAFYVEENRKLYRLQDKVKRFKG